MKWAILGCGWIADNFLQSLGIVDEAKVLACGSKSLERAQGLANKYNIPNAYDSYEVMLSDPNIDIVYIGTTHNFHYENAMMCLEHGKHVLIEKPVTVHASQFEEITGLAKSKGLFVMEAMWTRFLPGIEKLQQVIHDGMIGEIVLLNAGFGMRMPEDVNNRFYSKALAGGSLLDMGIYPLTFSKLVFQQKPEKVHSSVILTETGVDGSAAYALDYASGATAHLSSSMTSNLGAKAVIYGTKGKITVEEFFSFKKFHVTLDSGEDYQIDANYESTGKQFQAMEVMTCIKNGKLESEIHPHSESMYMMRTMDQMRLGWGVEYP